MFQRSLERRLETRNADGDETNLFFQEARHVQVYYAVEVVAAGAVRFDEGCLDDDGGGGEEAHIHE